MRREVFGVVWVVLMVIWFFAILVLARAYLFTGEPLTFSEETIVPTIWLITVGGGWVLALAYGINAYGRR